MPWKASKRPLGVGFATPGPSGFAVLLPGGNNNGFMESMSHKIDFMLPGISLWELPNFFQIVAASINRWNVLLLLLTQGAREF